MKRLRFLEILMLSESERSARRVPFPNLVTVIKGENDRGKSCLIKSLYMALGATPRNIHPNWIKLNVVLLLHFEVDGVRYRMLKTGKQYALFDSAELLVGVFSSITRDLGPVLADLFDFRLELTNATSREAEQATPAFLYLPFYFDQDRSWIESWESFESLQQFSQYRAAIAAFHTGLRPNEYYEAKARKVDAETRCENLRGERAVVKRVVEKIDHLMKATQFDIDIANYYDEIERLLVECNRLRDQEETLKEEMVQLENRRASIERQIHITESAANELGKDFTFASEELEDEVECPTCGAHYDNSFAERFSIADDEDRLRALLVQLRDERQVCSAEISKKRQSVSALSSKLSEITVLLESRQGDVKLQDVLRSEGKKEVRGVLRTEIDELNRQIGAVDDEIEAAEDAMKEFTSRKRMKEIKDYYLGRMSLHLQLLHVPELAEENYKDVHSRIKETGSDLPRALLAFYFAILKTIEKHSTATFCPIVIDSPKQQDQDEDNWRRILEFIRDNRPPESQLILGLVDDLGIDLGGDVVELTEERQLLQKSEYDNVAKYIRPYIDATLSH